MKDNTKDGYIAGTGLIFLGIITLVIAFGQGILSGGKITGIFGLFLTLIGIGSFVNPTIAETVVHWIRNQQKDDSMNLSQHQNNPANSPETGIVQRDQYINYGAEKKEETEKNNSYNRERVEKRLLDIKTELNNLKKLNYKEGGSDKSMYKKEIKGIIHKVYSNNPEASEKRLIHKVLWIISASTQENEHQDWYIEDIEGLITTINIIIREMDLE